MTTISRNTMAGAEAFTPKRITITGKSESHLGKGKELTVEQKAEVSRAKANSAALEAASAKQVREAEKSMHAESHEMYMPNVSDLSLENAKKSLGIAQVMIKNKEDVGVNINGRYGDQNISDLTSYTAALTDYIGKFEAAVSKAAVGESPAPSQASTTAASVYRQMQVLIDKGGNEG